MYLVANPMHGKTTKVHRPTPLYPLGHQDHHPDTFFQS
jgi:hypothetical protein